MTNNSQLIPPLRPTLSSLNTAIANEDSFAQRLKYEARALFLTKRSNQLSISSDMEDLWTLIKTSSPADSPESSELDYNDFKRIANLIENPKVKYVSFVLFILLITDFCFVYFVTL